MTNTRDEQWFADDNVKTDGGLAGEWIERPETPPETRTTIDMSELAQSISKLVDSEIEYKTTYNAYKGYEWGYHGQAATTKLTQAREEFARQFETAVRNILKEIEQDKRA